MVTLTWGNVSGIDREAGIFAIKASGVPYRDLKPEHMVLVDMNGKVVEGKWKPSSDTPTHLALYKAFPDAGGVTHTHSTHATQFAQACREIPCFGTTHADHFCGTVPVTRELTKSEVESEYEANTGLVIIERFKELDAAAIPGVLVAHHGPFTWGRNAAESARNAIAIERVAQMALGTLALRPDAKAIPAYLLARHYKRKHGPTATYGQKA